MSYITTDTTCLFSLNIIDCHTGSYLSMTLFCVVLFLFFMKMYVVYLFVQCVIIKKNKWKKKRKGTKSCDKVCGQKAASIHTRLSETKDEIVHTFIFPFDKLNGEVHIGPKGNFTHWHVSGIMSDPHGNAYVWLHKVHLYSHAETWLV